MNFWIIAYIKVGYTMTSKMSLAPVETEDIAVDIALCECRRLCRTDKIQLSFVCDGMYKVLHGLTDLGRVVIR